MTYSKPPTRTPSAQSPDEGNSTYTDICNFTFGKDHRTYELSLAILNEEVEHEAWFSEFLGEGPSGHFRRPKPGDSPYVAKFMSADLG